MICHLVFYRMKSETTEADADYLVREAQGRLCRLTGVCNLKAGKNIDSAGDYRVALSMDFEDEAALETYRVHPDHQTFVKNIAQPLISEIWRYDFLWE